LITSEAQRLTVGLADWPWSRWDDLLADSGWLAFLAKDQEVDGPTALMSLIENVDGRIGQRILELRGQAGADSRGKVAIIPHRWLHLIPYWALPSFADIPVSVFSSADEFVTSRKRETGLGGRGRECVIVANPTKDLLCSPSEARSVLRLGMPASTVLTAEAPSRATASVIASCLEDSALFHFSGHAYSDHGNPDNCAFLVAPASEQASDPFEEWVAAVTDWRKAAGGWRTGDVPGVGRLSERQYPDAGRLERRIERGYAPTLYALYIAGKLRRLGELWSVGDILAMGQSMPCRLAFLSACESGAAGGSSAYIDEYGGLPAALRLGGVGSVVCSMWDVDEGFTALYVDRFYCEVLAGQDDPVTILRQVSRWFREMRKADVLTALDHLADEVRERSAHAAMMLEAYRDKIDKTRGDVPYADAWEWASFYVIGGGRIGLAEFINHRG